MYTKDKSTRITLRLNESQFEFVRANASMLDVSPSEFLRMVINLTMANSIADGKYWDCLPECLEERGGREGRENDEGNINDIVQQ